MAKEMTSPSNETPSFVNKEECKRDDSSDEEEKDDEEMEISSSNEAKEPNEQVHKYNNTIHLRTINTKYKQTSLIFN